MKYVISQLPISNNNIFSSYDRVKSKINLDEYVNVWVDDTDDLATRDACERIFEKFNSGNRPKNFAGHSLSVSDLITFFAEGKKSITYYCDDFGWVEIRN